MQQDRRTLVLRTVVEKYIKTQQPVGSATVVRSFPTKVSSATIRNDMAALEKDGYLMEPHTSAGRVPTEKGYRYFVDKLVTLVPLSQPQIRAIRSFLTESMSLDDVLRRSARLLAQLTGQVAIAASPSIIRSHLRRFEIVRLAGTAFLLVIITDTGRIEQRTLQFGAYEEGSIPADGDIDDFCAAVNDDAMNQPVSQLAASVERVAHLPRFAHLSVFASRVKQAVSGIRDQIRQDNMYMSGASQLSHAGASPDAVASLLDALEEQVVVMQLMTNLSHSPTPSGVGVAIGSELQTPELSHAAAVSTEYTVGQEDTAFIGSIGPAHMDYSATMSAVKAVAEYLSTFTAHRAVGS